MFDARKDVVRVSERINGKRTLRDLKPVYEFYVANMNGQYESVTNVKCTKHTFKSNKEMKAAKKQLPSTATTFESDINVVFKTLAKHYTNSDVPAPNVCFFDIEVEYNEEFGYCPPSEALNKVTMISYHNSWTNTLGALVVKPHKTTKYAEMQQDVAEDIIDKFDNVILCEDEKEMLSKFLHIIEDADILSGWNSELFDIPYLVNRVGIILNKAEARRFCLWNQEPREQMKEVFDKPTQTYQLTGRVHLDYLELYKKHSYSVLPSYKLDSIGESEVGEKKVEYTGTLHSLYNEDFEKFIEYGLKDTLLLYKIDQKKEYINLANQLAHQNTVLFPTTLGSVALIDNAIINKAHAIGKVMFDKKRHSPKVRKAAGAWVADPHKGLQEMIGLVDLNSLYPSVIRVGNMSPETIVGQVRLTLTDAELDRRVEIQRSKSKSKKFEPDWAAAWYGFFGTTEFNHIKNADTDDILTVDFETGDTVEATGADLKDMLFGEDSNFIISANGTIFRKDREGIIPIILEAWYTERQNMQRAAIDFKHLTELDEGVPEKDMAEKLNGQSRLEFIQEACPELELDLIDGVYFAKDISLAKQQATYWKMMQQIRKILLNSLYGALLNEGSRFYDPRLGQSVTLTGRCITQHMGSKTNEILAGEYNHVGGVAVYGDSVVGETVLDVLIDGRHEKKTIEDLFNESENVIFPDSEKEYKKPDIKVLTYDQRTDESYYSDIHYAMRHQNAGSKFSIKSEEGHEVITTSDHGVMVEVDGVILECTPEQIQQFISENKDVFLIVSDKA